MKITQDNATFIEGEFSVPIKNYFEHYSECYQRYLLLESTLVFSEIATGHTCFPVIIRLYVQLFKSQDLNIQLIIALIFVIIYIYICYTYIFQISIRSSFYVVSRKILSNKSISSASYFYNFVLKMYSKFHQCCLIFQHKVLKFFFRCVI